LRFEQPEIVYELIGAILSLKNNGFTNPPIFLQRAVFSQVLGVLLGVNQLWILYFRMLFNHA
jgi:hypothetical protein